MAQNRLFLSFWRKGRSKCVNLPIMRFDGSESEILCRDFLPENSRLQRHCWSDFLNFDARLFLST